jgi:hypothetical protein
MASIVGIAVLFGFEKGLLLKRRFHRHQKKENLLKFPTGSKDIFGVYHFWS